MSRIRLKEIPWRVMVRFAPEPWFIVFMRTIMVPTDRYLLARTTGRYSLGGTTGAGTMLLTTTGRRTGKQRTTPLFFQDHSGAFTVVGSNFGHARHPAWSDNLLTHPQATVTAGNKVIPVTARLLVGDEHDAVWRSVVQYGPAYQNYLDRSGRSFRIFALEPAEHA